MAASKGVYTYRGGEKVVLSKVRDQFVARVKPDKLADIGFGGAQQVSSASSRIVVPPTELEEAMSELRQVAPTHHAYQIAETGEDYLITDRVFVTFKQTISDQAVSEFAGKYGLLLKEQYGDRDYLFQLTDHTGMNPVKLVVALTETDAQVELAENDLNYNISLMQVPLPTDPEYQRQWHLHKRFSHPDYDPRASSRCEAAWNVLKGFGSADVVIGVTDDGCKIDHPDFDSNGKFAGWGYFIGSRLATNRDIGAQPQDMYEAGNDHGTACSGVVAAEVDAALTVGAAPGCRLLPIKWQSLGGGGLAISDSRMLAMLAYVGDKVDVLSNSWGGVPRNIWSSPVRNRISDLAITGGRRGKGIVFLWAAGNENCLINHEANIDVPYTPGWEFGPGNKPMWVGPRTARRFQNNLVGIPGVMHVAALGSTAQRSHYSNYGPGIGITAPSNNLHSYYRLRNIKGLGIITTSGGKEPVDPQFGGTSSATPLVAGIAGLVISANPDLSALEVISLLKRTASKDLNMEPYPKTPAANFDPNPTWDVSPIAPFNKGDFSNIGSADGSWSPWFGHGNVDAQAAVAEALRLRSDGETDPGTGPDPEPPVQPPISKTVKYESAPNKRIPDNRLSGIADRIEVEATGKIRRIKLTIDITHQYIGDLSVMLTAPSGNRLLLHDRSGAGGSKIQTTYTVDSTPELATLLEDTAQGTWKIQVSDRARLDTGKFNSWGLELEVLHVNSSHSSESAESKVIPDGDSTGITQTLPLPAGTTIRDINVSVDITHPMIGDLRVSLLPPNGTPITLHDQTGGSQDNLIYTWRSQDFPALRALRGADSGGDWQLHVADRSTSNAGKLNHWKVETMG
ncbi:proprotein convertase P-domain-containing protein [filamentous cyanobacterium LEGE 11480]|uniref:Proprotein convertase P-domain-containing protein n=1 Tax=Romeriopsis navalis LEGE 11480 TaxID=2777977 RepID=A0A928Z443_9CYAN|nr:proprotein convertase P-domain-containing protein [Romeriopsis navalis]MBE9029900.1 proprotein convertase P-domain-containing protein [Romeriopsis navalis LEGE 11480]